MRNGQLRDTLATAQQAIAAGDPPPVPNSPPPAPSRILDRLRPPEPPVPTDDFGVPLPKRTLDDALVQLCVRLPHQKREAVKIRCTQAGVSVQEAVLTMIDDFLAECLEAFGPIRRDD